MSVSVDILIYQAPRDPVGNPGENEIGRFWINTESGAFFISREETATVGDAEVVTREWFREGQISETQFRQFLSLIHI